MACTGQITVRQPHKAVCRNTDNTSIHTLQTRNTYCKFTATFIPGHLLSFLHQSPIMPCLSTETRELEEMKLRITSKSAAQANYSAHLFWQTVRIASTPTGELKDLSCVFSCFRCVGQQLKGVAQELYKLPVSHQVSQLSSAQEENRSSLKF